MNQREVESIFTELLKPTFVSEGFKFRKSKLDFVRKISGIKQIVSFAVLNRSPDFYIAPFVEIIFGDAEKIYYSFYDELAKYSKDSALLITSHRHFFDGLTQFGFEIKTHHLGREEAEPILSDHAEETKLVFREKMLTYFDVNKDVSKIHDNLISKKCIINEASPYGDLLRIYLAAVAKAADFDAIVEHYKKPALKHAELGNEFSVTMFDKVVGNLRSHIDERKSLVHYSK